MEPCLFCKIVNKEIPADIVYENDHWLVFLDIKPINPGHTLILPKDHSRNFLDLSDDLATEVGPIIKKVAKAVKTATGAEAINIGINNEAAAGQVIFHTHIHIIPRHSTDGYASWHRQGDLPTKEQFAEMVEKVRSSLA